MQREIRVWYGAGHAYKQAPSPLLDLAAGAPVLFLPGSIEQGSAPDWQAHLCTALADLPVTVLNPRRDEWDASWTQSIDNDLFVEQVEWEFDGLERTDVIAVYFAPSTRAPITLLELGLHARSGRLVVGCPEGYWRRKGNVDIVCRRFGVEQVSTLEALAGAVRARLG